MLFQDKILFLKLKFEITNHSDGISYTDDTEKIGGIGFGVTVSSQMLRQIKVRHDEPCE